MLKLDSGIIWTVFNLIILYILMRKFLIGPIMGVIEKRKQLIDSQLSNASDTQKSAMQLKAEYEESLKESRDKAGEIMEKARTNANAEYEKIVKAAEAESHRLISEAEKTISIEKEKALRDMQSEVASLAMIAAAKIVIDKTSEGNDQSIYNNFIKKAGEANDSNGN